MRLDANGKPAGLELGFPPGPASHYAWHPAEDPVMDGASDDASLDCHIFLDTR
jgi:hypothetical protein